MKYVGVTERGDAGLDLSWTQKLYDANIIISKNLTMSLFHALLDFRDKCIFHMNITGMGKTVIEPNVPVVALNKAMVMGLIDRGFPAQQVVLRIDPVFPTEKGIARAEEVLRSFKAAESIKRVRFSILDMYPHVVDRFRERGIEPPYTTFHAPEEMRQKVVELFERWEDRYEIEACAEFVPDRWKIGCISKKDLDILGVSLDSDPIGRQRPMCLCLGAKKELLSNKKPCGHKCMYCYWRDK